MFPSSREILLAAFPIDVGDAVRVLHRISKRLGSVAIATVSPTGSLIMTEGWIDAIIVAKETDCHSNGRRIDRPPTVNQIGRLSIAVGV